MVSPVVFELYDHQQHHSVYQEDLEEEELKIATNI